VLLSLAAHGAFLGFLLLSLPDAPPPPPPTIQVELVPPPLVSPLPRRAAVQADRAEAPAARAGASPVQPRLLERQQVAPVFTPAAPAPAPPPLGPGPTAPAASPARPAAPAPAAADDARDRLGAALRSTGCRNWNLSAAERERCLEREGALAREAVPDALRAERRARKEEAEVANRPPNATALVRGPGDDPRDHPMVGLPPVMVGVVIPFGKPPKAIEPIAPSTLRGDDDALRPKPRGN
jgi:hypothetical protein